MRRFLAMEFRHDLQDNQPARRGGARLGSAGYGEAGQGRAGSSKSVCQSEPIPICTKPRASVGSF
jgi:hypothetical protein